MNAVSRENLTVVSARGPERGPALAPLGADGACSGPEGAGPGVLLTHVLEQLREGHAKSARELRGGFHGRVPETGFDAGDVRTIQICPFCQHLLSPGFRLSKAPDTGAKRLQQAIATRGHASGLRARVLHVD